MTQREIEIIPTVVPDSLDAVVQARDQYAPYVQALHIDTADGRFAPNETWAPHSGETLPDPKETYYEAHMMVKNPLAAGSAFAHAGARRIVGHVETFANAESAREAFKMWRGAGAKEVGLGILFGTPLEVLEPYLPLCDCIIMMTIARIGTQGIPFEEGAVARVEALHARHPKLLISVDGGVSAKNISALARAGARRFSVGSAIAKSPDPAAAYEALVAAARG